MIREMDEARHGIERGAILCALKQEYGAAMVSTRTLAAALNLVGLPMTQGAMQFSLTLLADLGYLQIWRATDTAAWRADRANDMQPHAILFARLLPRGLALIDGKLTADPNVSF